MLRSDTLMLDNKLFPLYQERVTALTFTTEHNNEKFCCDEDDEDDDEDDGDDEAQSLLMTGTGKLAIREILKEVLEKLIAADSCVQNSYDVGNKLTYKMELNYHYLITFELVDELYKNTTSFITYF